MLENFRLQHFLCNFFSFFMVVSKFCMMIIQYPKKCKNSKKSLKKWSCPTSNRILTNLESDFKDDNYYQSCRKSNLLQSICRQNFKFLNSFWATVEELKLFFSKNIFSPTSRKTAAQTTNNLRSLQKLYSL